MEELRVIIDFGLFILIWLVQLVIYPSLLFCDKQLLREWHYRYTGIISIFVVPLMFSQLFIVGFQSYNYPTGMNIASSVLVIFAWVFTFTLSVPAHNKIKKGQDVERSIYRLINSNWFRTVSWSMVFILGVAGLTNPEFDQ